jgi:hypothetical protein
MAHRLDHPRLPSLGVDTGRDFFQWFLHFIKRTKPTKEDPVPSLNLKPNPRGGTAKKRTSSLYKKFVEANQKKKIKQATKSKTNQLALNAVFGPSKRRKRMVCRDPTPSDTPDSDTGLAVPVADNSS